MSDNYGGLAITWTESTEKWGEGSRAEVRTFVEDVEWVVDIGNEDLRIAAIEQLVEMGVMHALSRPTDAVLRLLLMEHGDAICEEYKEEHL